MVCHSSGQYAPIRCLHCTDMEINASIVMLQVKEGVYSRCRSPFRAVESIFSRQLLLPRRICSVRHVLDAKACRIVSMSSTHSSHWNTLSGQTTFKNHSYVLASLSDINDLERERERDEQC